MNVPFSIIKEQFQPSILKNSLCLAARVAELQQGDIIFTNYDASLGQKKLLLFLEMRVMKKIFTRVAANYFFNQFN